ncbi:MAG: PEP-CTERM system histidine kinase PrsK [Gammaproteobacteria bacterium]|nr:PEP-CTERM system histidine kinase PrsK [Gammaproteobacteria bacterium]
MAIESISHTVSAFVYLVFFAVLLTDKHRGRTKQLLLASALASAVWSVSIAAQSLMNSYYPGSHIFEVIKNLTWLLFILSMLTAAYSQGVSVAQTRRGLIRTGLIVVAVLTIMLYGLLQISLRTENETGMMIVLMLLFAVTGIVLVEQLYRNVPAEQRWAIKYLCIGLMGSYIYNFYMYSDALLYQRIDPVLWQTRGFVEAVLVPLIAVSVSKDPLWSPEFFISRRVVFHTTTLLASAVYLLIMGIAGYYVKEFGGSWGPVVQAFLLFFTIIVLVLVLTSRRTRAKLKVFVSKHFYPYKYDYREEWLRFIRTISFGDEHLYRKTIKSIAQIIDSPGGMLWLRQERGFFKCVDAWQMPLLKVREPAGGSMARFIEDHEFVVCVDELNTEPEVYSRVGKLELPTWVNELSPWLIVPLIHINKLIGFVVLERSEIRRLNFNWEDSDLLKTAARQVASYLEQQKASIALAEARQFEQFNKISTYIVHDIKNLVAQLSLIMTNAEKHKHNPLFMEDVIGTVGNTVNKMNKMLEIVSSKSSSTKSSRIDLIPLLEELVRMRQQTEFKPVPVLACETDTCYVKADKVRLLSTFGHLVQNAQDATPDHGDIRITQSVEDGQVVLKFSDTGHGMDQAFIETQLFKPFKSTKGEGMGIGVYETKQIILALGGSIDVHSTPGKGTCFRIKLPIA